MSPKFVELITKIIYKVVSGRLSKCPLGIINRRD